jgi:glucoamylase
MRPRFLTGLLVAALALPATAGLAGSASAAEAPGAPGISGAWTTGAKHGLGTSTTTASKVWFTLGQGITHEVYYPQLDVPDVQDLQYIVSDGSSFTDLERDATTHTVALADPRALQYRQVNTAKRGSYRITKTYVTDPDRHTLLVRTRFQVLSGGPLQLYVLYNPSLGGSAMGDSGRTSGGQLVASDSAVSSALAADTGFLAATNGYSGTASDGYTDLRDDHRLNASYDAATTPGNLVQTARIPVTADTTFTLALGFGSSQAEATANTSVSLSRGFATVASAYTSGWQQYLSSLPAPPRSVTGNGLTTQYQAAVMALKAHEDKTYRGAFVASMSVPWGQAVNADLCCAAGYHAVWARDLYEVATTLIAAGDTAAADRALDYLLTVQRRPDGSYPQNSRLDGTAVFGGLQMDEVAFPIVLAWQLGRTDAATYAKLKPSAEFLLHRGPATPQERWEEEGGYSPSTIAAEIAGLVCAADIADRNADPGAVAAYRRMADDWQSRLESWTVTSTGHLAGGRYYERIDDNGDPNDGHTLSINNGGGDHDERDVVDAGFLELVRLGVKPAADPAVAASVSVVDATISADTPSGRLWYRYNHDGYGETSTGAPYTGAGIGRLWPILTGERGEYELARGRDAQAHLIAMASSANPGYLIPEQVWDRPDAHGFTFGEGTDSATPLAWSLAQFVRLARSIDAGRNLETPSVVAGRYTNPAKVTVTVTVPATTDGTGRTVRLTGTLGQLGGGLPDWDPAGLPMARVDATHWRITLTAPAGTRLEYKYTLGDWGTVEKDAFCGERPNRTGVLAGVEAVTDGVGAWRGVPPC